LSGWAGTGKSTIARTIAYKYREIGCLGASFFFSRGKEDISHADKLLTTIAAQLALRSPALGQLIRDAISRDPNVASSKDRSYQWKFLIQEPLLKLEASSLQQPLILVIDALDECDGDNDIRRIINLLSEAKTLETVRLRIFLTSRPETPIRLGFLNMPGILHQDLILHKIARATVDHDILVFFEYRFGVIRNKSEDLRPNWPGKTCIDKLVSSAHGLFIYAATVCRFIEKGIEDFPANDLLRLVLPDENIANTSKMSRNITTYESPTKELDMIYTQVLEYSLKNVRHAKDKEQLATTFRLVVGSIVILFNPLSPFAIARLLNMDVEVVKKRLNHLRSVLEFSDTQEQPIRLLHPSFRDFLLSDKRCYSRQFWVDGRETHEMLAAKCLELMSRPKCLGKNICHLESYGMSRHEIDSRTMDDCLPADVRYACRYWIHHLEQSGRHICDQDSAHIFLQEHFLHWLEALSLIGVMSESISLISTLQSLIAVSKYNVIFIRLLYQREHLER
jgi:hypothetical protein